MVSRISKCRKKWSLWILLKLFLNRWEWKKLKLPWMFAQRKITICALINKKAPSEERGLFYGNFFKFVLVNLRLRLYVCFCLLRWRRCHAVTEVDKVLPVIKFNKHYRYKKTSTPYPRWRGIKFTSHVSRITLHQYPPPAGEDTQH